MTGAGGAVLNPRDAYMMDMLKSIEAEALATRQPYMTLDEAIDILIDDRFERGILSRDRSEEHTSELQSL
jgi:hypothetical protein